MEKDSTLSSENANEQTFAIYLSKQYVAKKGLAHGTLPEASALANVSDIILSGIDGFSYLIICLIDCEAHPEKRLEMSLKLALEIARQLPVTDKVNIKQLSIAIQVIEVGRRITEADCARLKSFRYGYGSLVSKINISAWILDTATGSVWTNSPIRSILGSGSFIKKIMQATRASDAELRPITTSEVLNPDAPLITYVLLAILAVVYCCGLIFGIELNRFACSSLHAY
jgi:hypothetical protein